MYSVGERGEEWCAKLTSIRECCGQPAVGNSGHQHISAGARSPLLYIQAAKQTDTLETYSIVAQTGGHLTPDNHLSQENETMATRPRRTGKLTATTHMNILQGNDRLRRAQGMQRGRDARRHTVGT